MSILQLISSEGFHGAESMLCSLSTALVRLGWNVIVGVFDDARTPHLEIAVKAREAGLSVELLPCRGRADWSSVRCLRALIRNHGVRIVHSHGYKADLYARMGARSLGVKLVSTCHNWSDRRLTMRLYAALDRLVLRSFDRVTTPSPVVAGVLARSGVDPGKVTCIANGVDIETFDHAAPALRRELPNPAGYVVGFAARMVPSKGGDLLLHAASRVLGVCPDVTFVLVGDGPSRTAWTKLAVQLGIAGSVVFAGSRSDMPGVYAAFDQFVLPSLDEAMPMSLLEAMAARKPVIATRVGAVPELVVDGRTGYLLEPGDIQGLAGAISRLKRAPDLARQLGEAGHRLVTASYSSAAMARAYLSVYRSVAPAPLAPTLVPNESN